MIGPFAYIGGKRRLAKRIVALLPTHHTYVEPFAGGAQVFFAKEPSAVEVLNDLSKDVVTFLKVCTHHPIELARCLQHAPSSRLLWEAFHRQDPMLLTDIQRAARFFYLQKNSFGGHVMGQHFHSGPEKTVAIDPGRLPAVFDAVSRRLARAQIEHLPYERVLERFDRASTVFYLDPPYVGAKHYEFNLADADYECLATRLFDIKGNFVLSINDHHIARRAFRKFNIRDADLTYPVGSRVSSGRELLISNYTLPGERKAESA